MDRSELLPCPFCGAQPKQDHHACPNVWCDNEACTIVGVVFSGGPRHWNTRAAPPPPAEQASGYDAPVAATLADAAADPALTMDAARELLADTARAITAGTYAALSQRPVVDEAMVPRKDMAALYAAYVRLLETGRDRIMDLGGDCDPVDVMEWADPELIQARRTLAPQQPEKGETP